MDITYYIGSEWEVPYESMIPLKDIPIFDYNIENKMTLKLGTASTFRNVLEHHFSALMDFCSQISNNNSFNQ